MPMKAQQDCLGSVVRLNEMGNEAGKPQSTRNDWMSNRISIYK